MWGHFRSRQGQELREMATHLETSERKRRGAVNVSKVHASPASDEKTHEVQVSLQYCPYKGCLARGALLIYVCPSIDELRSCAHQASPRGHDERNNLPATVHVGALSDEFQRHGTGPCVESAVQQ